MATRWEITKAVRASDLPAPSRLILLVLADVAEVATAEIPEKFTPSLSVLERETGLSRRAVQDHMKSLESAGWVVRTRPAPAAQWAGERVRYRLALPAGVVQEMHQGDAGGAPPLMQEVHHPSAGGAPGVVQEVRGGGAGGAPLYTDHSDLSQITLTSPPASSTPKKTSTKTTDDPEFAKFWSTYPRRVAKGAARRAWTTATKKATAAVIIAGVEGYAARCERERTEDRFIAHPATWLNGERWADDMPRPRIVSSTPSGAIPIDQQCPRHPFRWRGQCDACATVEDVPA